MQWNYTKYTNLDEFSLVKFDWLEIDEFKLQLIKLQSSSICIEKFIKQRKNMVTTEKKRLFGNTSKNVDDKITETWNLIQELFKEADVCNFNNFYICLCLQVIIFANE